MKWIKMIDDRDMLIYGKPNNPKVLIAEKWDMGWAIDEAKDITPKNDDKVMFEFAEREAITNVRTKKEARENIKMLIKEAKEKKIRR